MDLRALLATLPRHPRPTPIVPPPVAPFAPLPELPDATWVDVEAAALAGNDRYLLEFLEAYSFCPFARGGRERGQTARWVHRVRTAEVEPFLAWFRAAAGPPQVPVVQVIVPMIEVDPDAWITFCNAVTDLGNASRPDGRPVFAVAPLHPELRYTPTTPYSIIPLFRRTPDPTIQWVRLDALAQIYRGRSGDTVYVDPDDVDAYLAGPHKPPLFERIAETNHAMATRLGIANVERRLGDLARSARARYAQLLLGAAPSPSRTAAHPVAPPLPAPPRAPRFARGRRWAVALVAELPVCAPQRFLVDGVELVVVRTEREVHVLHGRCPHRDAPLADAAVVDDHLVCARHGWDFALTTGRSRSVPQAAVRRFAATIEDELVWLDCDTLRRSRRDDCPTFRPDDDVA